MQQHYDTIDANKSRAPDQFSTDTNKKDSENIPTLHLEVNQPIQVSKFYAIPIISVIVKLFLLIPIGIFYFLYIYLLCFITIINCFVILITGRFWMFAYKILSNFLIFQAEICFFIAGITNQYPYFHRSKSLIQLSYEYPKKPNRLFAIPILGFFTRFVLVLPHMIYTSIILYGTIPIYFFAWIFILFFNNYPIRFYELWRDGTRLALNDFMYIVGLTDTYPSYKISMNYPLDKIILILIGSLFVIMLSSFNSSYSRKSVNIHYSSTHSMNNFYSK